MSARRRSPANGFAIACLAILFAGCASEPNSDSDRTVTKVAVLPLANESVDPEESDYLANGITRAVITKLTQAELQVTPWTTVRRFAGSMEPPENIARELGVEAVLVGTFELSGERILTTLSLVNVDTGLQTWANEFEVSFDELFDVQRRIATGAAASLKRELTGEEEVVLAAAESESVEAYDLFLQGAQLVSEATEEANAVALSYFDRALEVDPNLVEAHVGRGVVFYDRYYYGWGGGFDSLVEAEASYRRAVELDPAAMEARRGLCHVSVQRLGGNEGCIEQARAARRFARSDNDLESLLAEAEALGYAALVEKAIPLLERIIELDPANAAAHWQLVFFASRHAPELAVATAARFVDRFGDDVDVYRNGGIAYELLGNTDRAREFFERGIETWERSGAGDYAQLFLFAGLLHARTGDRSEAEALWRRGVDTLEAHLGERGESAFVRSFLTCLYGLLGNDAAFEEEVSRFDPRSPVAVDLVLTHALRGELGRAKERLRSSVEHGMIWPEKELHTFWAVAGLEPSVVNELQPLAAEHEAARQRLLEKYGEP